MVRITIEIPPQCGSLTYLVGIAAVNQNRTARLRRFMMGDVGARKDLYVNVVFSGATTTLAECVGGV